MARTKKAKWKAGREVLATRREDNDIAHYLQLSYPQATEEMINETMKDSTSDDDMESEDGGVRLSIEPEDTLMENNISSESFAEADYFQQPTTLSDRSQQLWQRPSGRTIRAQETKGKPKLAVARIYEQSLRLLKSHWSCKFEHCIPDHLRPLTPYSLALLYSIRRVASQSKGNYEVGQAAISRAWTERIYRLQIDAPTPEEQFHFVETRPILGKECEPTIQENSFGLMVADVSDALEILKSKKYSDLPTPKEMRQAQRVARGLPPSKASKREKQMKTKADRVAKKQAKLEKKETKILAKLAQMSRPGKQHDDSSNPAGVPPNSPTEFNERLESLSQHFRISSSPHLQPSTAAQPDQLNGESTYMLSVNDRASYKQMANMLQNVGVDRNNPIPKKRLKKLEKGGLSRNKASGVLPSEKTNPGNLGALPALPARVSGMTAEELTKLSKLSLDELPG